MKINNKWLTSLSQPEYLFVSRQQNPPNRINNGLTSLHPLAFAQSGSTVFVGTSDRGVFTFNPSYSSWSSFNTGLSNMSIYSLLVSNTNIFAGTSNGVWIRPLSDLLGVTDLTENNNFTVYPNPFSDAFNISLNKNIKTGRLNLFNVLGRKVYTEPFACDKKSFSLKLDRGIYFVQLTNETETWIQKIVKE